MQRREFILGLSAWTATPLLSPSAQASESRVVLAVIVAASSPVIGLATHELRRLYLGDPVSGPRGHKIVPLSQAPRSPSRVGFDRAVLGMSPEEVTRYWIDRRIRGQSCPPKSIDSPDLLQRVVARLPGGLGYVRASDLRSEVKALRIDGRLPGDQGYPVVY
jgi:hypothetical protein